MDSAAKTLVSSSSLTHLVNGDGIWMSTGLAYDSSSSCLLVGHTFVNGSSGSDHGKIYFRTFDSSFSQVYSEVMVDSQTANRAHFLLKGDTLFVVYDESPSGFPSIYGLKYTIGR